MNRDLIGEKSYEFQGVKVLTRVRVSENCAQDVVTERKRYQIIVQRDFFGSGDGNSRVENYDQECNSDGRQHLSAEIVLD